MNKKESKFLENVAVNAQSLSGYECRIVMLLVAHEDTELTKTMIKKSLEASFSAVSKAVDNLTSMNILVPSKTEGRNRFYKANLDLELQDKKSLSQSLCKPLSWCMI